MYPYFNCRHFQNLIHITVKLILNRKIIIQWNFKKVLKHNMHKANYVFSWSVFFLLKVWGYFILTLNDSKCFILALKRFVFVFKKSFFSTTNKLTIFTTTLLHGILWLIVSHFHMNSLLFLNWSQSATWRIVANFVHFFKVLHKN